MQTITGINTLSVRTALVAGLATLTALSASAKTHGGDDATAAATASASATIVQPLAITRAADLAFGEVYPGTGGTVTVDTNGNRTAAGPDLGNTTGVSAASFVVTGEPDSHYTVTLPTSTTLTHGNDTMTVSGFTSDVSDGEIDENGQAVLNVGAVLNVTQGQRSGNYTGTFSVTVSYD